MDIQDLKLEMNFATGSSLGGGVWSAMVDVTVSATVTVPQPLRFALMHVSLHGDDTGEAEQGPPSVLTLGSLQIVRQGSQRVEVSAKFPRFSLDEDPGIADKHVKPVSHNGIIGRLVTVVYKEDEFRARVTLVSGLSAFADQRIAWSAMQKAPSTTPSML